MVRPVAWSPAALDDVDAIAAFIAKDSRHFASSVVSKIIVAAQALEDFPQIGRVVPELGNESIRERVIYSYRLIYEVNENGVTILAVIHGKRLLSSMTSPIKAD